MVRGLSGNRSPKAKALTGHELPSGLPPTIWPDTGVKGSVQWLPSLAPLPRSAAWPVQLPPLKTRMCAAPQLGMPKLHWHWHWRSSVKLGLQGSPPIEVPSAAVHAC